MTAYVFLGTAIQAFIVAGLIALRPIEVTPVQQVCAGSLFIIASLIMATFAR